MANGAALEGAARIALEWIAEVLEVQLTEFVRGVIGHMADVAVHRHAIDAGQASTVRALHFFWIEDDQLWIFNLQLAEKSGQEGVLKA